jgi:hypothetical protein
MNFWYKYKSASDIFSDEINIFSDELITSLCYRRVHNFSGNEGTECYWNFGVILNFGFILDFGAILNLGFNLNFGFILDFGVIQNFGVVVEEVA